MVSNVQEFIIEGMTCNGCVAHVQAILLSEPEIDSAVVTLNPNRALITTSASIDVDHLQERLGKYKIEKKASESTVEKAVLMEGLPQPSWTTYQPLILIVLFIVGVAVLSQHPIQSFDWMKFMRHFMAGFFIVFSFFKLLNINGFADSYSMYDIVARQWKAWGFIYPFIELGLGISYLIDFAPFTTNILTILVLGVSSIGVIESNLNKRRIKCACLGDVFNLPMSTVTIIEDVSMVLMAVVMLVLS